MNMSEFIDELLSCLKICFSRNATYPCFVVVIIGFMLHADTLGVTAIMRDLVICPTFYETILGFFGASSWFFVFWLKTPQIQ
jgi:hypothetical protein